MSSQDTPWGRPFNPVRPQHAHNGWGGPATWPPPGMKFSSPPAHFGGGVGSPSSGRLMAAGSIGLAIGGLAALALRHAYDRHKARQAVDRMNLARAARGVGRGRHNNQYTKGRM